MQLKYTRKGEGDKSIILMHGWGGSIKSLAPLQKELAKSGFQVLNIEFPGFGDSPAPAMPMKLSNFVWLIERLIDELHLYKPILLGHSFGGKVAMAFAIKYPDKIQKLILVNSSGLTPKNRLKRNINLKISKLFGPIFKSKPLSPIYNLTRKTYYKVIVRESDYIKADHMRPTLENILSENLDDQVSRIKVPTLIIWGEQDKATPIWMGYKLHELIPTAKIEVIKDETHGLPLKRPELICSIVTHSVY